MSAISLWLDSYDDLYSDFDTRHYSKRRISEDFIDELKAALKYKKEDTETLTLLLPLKQRKIELEQEITESLKKQFSDRFELLKVSVSKIFIRGISLTIIGILVMAIDSLIAYIGYKSYIMSVIKIVMEPSGWFLIWNGLDFLFYENRKLQKEVDFYKKLKQLKINYDNY